MSELDDFDFGEEEIEPGEEGQEPEAAEAEPEGGVDPTPTPTPMPSTASAPTASAPAQPEDQWAGVDIDKTKKQLVRQSLDLETIKKAQRDNFDRRTAEVSQALLNGEDPDKWRYPMIGYGSVKSGDNYSDVTVTKDEVHDLEALKKCFLPLILSDQERAPGSTLRDWTLEEVIEAVRPISIALARQYGGSSYNSEGGGFKVGMTDVDLKQEADILVLRKLMGDEGRSPFVSYFNISVRYGTRHTVKNAEGTATRSRDRRLGQTVSSTDAEVSMAGGDGKGTVGQTIPQDAAKTDTIPCPTCARGESKDKKGTGWIPYNPSTYYNGDPARNPPKFVKGPVGSNKIIDKWAEPGDLVQCDECGNPNARSPGAGLIPAVAPTRERKSDWTDEIAASRELQGIRRGMIKKLVTGVPSAITLKKPGKPMPTSVLLNFGNPTQADPTPPTIIKIDGKEAGPENLQTGMYAVAQVPGQFKPATEIQAFTTPQPPASAPAGSASGVITGMTSQGALNQRESELLLLKLGSESIFDPSLHDSSGGVEAGPEESLRGDTEVSRILAAAVNIYRPPLQQGQKATGIYPEAVKMGKEKEFQAIWDQAFGEIEHAPFNPNLPASLQIAPLCETVDDGQIITGQLVDNDTLVIKSFNPGPPGPQGTAYMGKPEDSHRDVTLKRQKPQTAVGKQQQQLDTPTSQPTFEGIWEFPVADGVTAISNRVLTISMPEPNRIWGQVEASQERSSRDFEAVVKGNTFSARLMIKQTDKEKQKGMGKKKTYTGNFYGDRLDWLMLNLRQRIFNPKVMETMSKVGIANRWVKTLDSLRDTVSKLGQRLGPIPGRAPKPGEKVLNLLAKKGEGTAPATTSAPTAPPATTPAAKPWPKVSPPPPWPEDELDYSSVVRLLDKHPNITTSNEQLVNAFMSHPQTQEGKYVVTQSQDNTPGKAGHTRYTIKKAGMEECIRAIFRLDYKTLLEEIERGEATIEDINSRAYYIV